jgi:hypothetical protein
MKHIFQNFSILIVSLFFWGCGDSNSGISLSNQKDQELTEYIHIGNQHWSIEKPEKWSLLENLYKKESYAIFAMEYRDQKFIIQQNQESDKNLEETIFNNAKNDLFFFYPVEFSTNLWKYRGKLDAKTPLREFWQKTYRLKTYPYILIGTCSFEYAPEKEHDCEKIIDSWQEYVIEEKSK